MPRYIDADKVMEEINRIGGHNLCEWETIGVKALIDRQPTADVAPRAEVAREIVDFLFRRSKSLQHLFKDDPNSAQCFRGRFELENAAVIIANEYGVDLEKKYTEGENG